MNKRWMRLRRRPKAMVAGLVGALMVVVLVVSTPVPGVQRSHLAGSATIVGLTLDAYGGVHPLAGSSISAAGAASWPDWPIARDVALLPDQSGGYVLDGWGGVHPLGTAPPVSTSVYWPHWDIARHIALLPSGGGGYVLDAWGGVHPFGSAPPLATTAYWPNWDIARGIVLLPSGSGGYVLDGWGAIHPFGAAPPLATTAYWPNWDIARGIVLLPSGTGGYVLDGWGGVHPFGSAPSLAITAYWSNWDIARGIALVGDGSGGYVLDGWGALHSIGTAAPVEVTGYTPGEDIARGMQVVAGASPPSPTPTPRASATPTSSSTPTSTATSTPTPTATPTPTPTAKTCNVTTYGADPAGQHDSLLAIRSAIADCSSSPGSTVYLPAQSNGSPALYLVGSTEPPKGNGLVLTGAYPITFAGAGRDSVTIRQMDTDSSLVSMPMDHTIIQDMTLDTMTTNAGASLGSGGNYEQILRLRVLHGNTNNPIVPTHPRFSIYMAGGGQPSGVATGNQIHDLVMSDLSCDDGLSWSFQNNSVIDGLVYTGSRVAIYIDTNMMLDNFTYTPGPQTCPAKQGFWITHSSHVTIQNYVSSGEGGRSWPNSNGSNGNSDVTIAGIRLTGSGNSMTMEDVTNLVIEPLVVNGQTVVPCDFGANGLSLSPLVSETVTVSNCRLEHVSSGSTATASLSVQFSGDSFLGGLSSPTFVSNGTPMAGTVSGGTWCNYPRFESSTGVALTVSNLGGYPGGPAC